MCTKAVAVVRAVGADFFLDRWHVEIAACETHSIHYVGKIHNLFNVKIWWYIL
jgi:hypothetical protein